MARRCLLQGLSGGSKVPSTSSVKSAGHSPRRRGEAAAAFSMDEADTRSGTLEGNRKAWGMLAEAR